MRYLFYYIKNFLWGYKKIFFFYYFQFFFLLFVVVLDNLNSLRLLVDRILFYNIKRWKLEFEFNGRVCDLVIWWNVFSRYFYGKLLKCIWFNICRVFGTSIFLYFLPMAHKKIYNLAYISCSDGEFTNCSNVIYNN